MNCIQPGPSVHRFSPGENTGVGRHFLLQGTFLTQGLNPRLLFGGQTFTAELAVKPHVFF